MILPRKARAVIFDMDGLIVDNEPLYRDAMMAVARDRGHDMPLEFYLATLGLPGDGARALFSDRFGKGFDFDDLWQATLTRYYELAPSKFILKPGAIELLHVLDDLHLPRAICTSARHQDVRHQLFPHGLLDDHHGARPSGGDTRNGAVVHLCCSRPSPSLHFDTTVTAAADSLAHLEASRSRRAQSLYCAIAASPNSPSAPKSNAR